MASASDLEVEIVALGPDGERIGSPTSITGVKSMDLGTASFSCALSGNHEVDSDGVVEYSDGVFVGECARSDCSSRISFRSAVGSMESVRLEELAAQVFATPENQELLGEFHDRYLELKSIKRRVDGALEKAELALQSAVNRGFGSSLSS